jgi:Leucine-rich repeat (LRR) protein
MVKYITPLIIFLINLSWGQDCTADDGTSGVEFNFFNNESVECYSIENTTVINKNNCSTGSKTGSIPPEIGLLTNLTTLDLACNELTGDIPPEIGNLTSLTYIDLHYNQLTSIPPEIGNLTSLTHLNLKMAVTGPHIGDAIPPEMGNLTNLTYLDLSDNELGCHNYNWLGDWQTDNCNEHCDDTDECTANIPSEIGNLTELTFLSLSDNHLSGEIPSSIGNLVNLERLSFWDNDLSGEIPESIGNLTNLNLLWLKHNQLTGPIPSTIGNLTQLGEDLDAGVDDYQPGLDLSYNELTGEIPSSIGNLTNLATLVLEYNQLTGPLPPEIGYMTSLVTLNLKNNQINGVIPSELEYLSNMSCLWLAYNNLRGEIPEELCNIDVCGSQCNNSNYVFSGNNLCPPYPQCFEEFGIPSYPISIIGGQDCNLYPDCADGYTGINIPPHDGYCYFESDLDVLQEFIELNESLSGEPLNIETGGSISIYWHSGRLYSLNLPNSQLTTYPESIWNLDSLVRLDLQDNQLTGSIPSGIGNLTILNQLYLNDNNLTGSIPPELGELNNIYTIDLSRNQFTGQVPQEFWDNFYWNRLLLRDNQFTGEIPESICDENISWNSYTFFDIRDNKICPPYPSCIENRMGNQDTSYCSGVNVYPGDTDNNGIVDALDVLPIGVYFFENGPPRDTTGFFWSPVSGEPWTILPAAFSDANGDGVVDEIDIIGVGVNWGKTHETRGNTFVLDPNDETLFINHQAAFQEIYNSLSGGSEVINEIREMLRSVLGIQIPEVFSLYQNYPNPFNPTTMIQFHLPTDESISLTVYNILGKTVIEPIKDVIYQSGTYSILLDGSQLSSGLYYYALKAGMYHDVRKMIVMK